MTRPGFIRALLCDVAALASIIALWLIFWIVT